MKLQNISLWAEDVVESLQKLGGEGTASEIAAVVKSLTKHNRETKDWKSSVLNVLNDYCSTKVDYKRIKSRKPNHPSLFVDLGNKGRERIWGLQSNVTNKLKLQIESSGNSKYKIPTQMLDHEKWAKLALRELVNHIKNFKGGNKYITYGELARRINYPQPHTGNLFGLRIGKTLGKMGHMFDNMIIDGEPVPLIQALVVGSSTKLPSDGLKEFNKTYPDLSTEKKKDFAQIEYDKIFKFGNRWEKVLQNLKIVPDPGEKQKSNSNRRYNPYGSEGSPEHRRLRDYVANNPSVLGLKIIEKGIIEYPLKSGDCIDVVFDSPHHIIAVEVKSARSGFDDLERGMYQSVKYDAVLNAENRARGIRKRVKLFLVIEGSLSVPLKKIQKQLNISVIENVKPN